MGDRNSFLIALNLQRSKQQDRSYHKTSDAINESLSILKALRCHLLNHLFIFSFPTETEGLQTFSVIRHFLLLYSLSSLYVIHKYFLCCCIFFLMLVTTHVSPIDFMTSFMGQESGKKQEKHLCEALPVVTSSISEYILYFTFISFTLFNHICQQFDIYYCLNIMYN